VSGRSRCSKMQLLPVLLPALVTGCVCQRRCPPDLQGANTCSSTRMSAVYSQPFLKSMQKCTSISCMQRPLALAKPPKCQLH
jgi:hypothetical protein